MKEHNFKLVFDIPRENASIDEVVEALGTAGCDDAIVGIGKSGRLALTFDRKSSSAREAVLTAILDTRKAIPTAKLVEASPDLVDMTDVASIVDRSRQNVRKLLLSSTPSPVPVHEGNPSLWHLFHLLVWLRDEKEYSIDPCIIEIAKITMEVNVATWQHRMETYIDDEIKMAVYS